MSLTTIQSCSLLKEIPEIRVTQDADGVLVHVPAIDRSMPIDADAVRQHTYVTGPSGEQSLLLLLDVAGVPVQAIVASADLVFTPDTRDSGLGFRAVDVTDAPPLVSFSEMMRDLKTIGRTSSTEGRVDKAVGALVMLRYCIAGAKRLGIECRDAETQLQQSWERTGLRSAALRRSAGR